MMKTSTYFLLLISLLWGRQTLAQCDAPLNLSSSYSNNISSFNWDQTPNASAYEIQLKYSVYGWNNPEATFILPSNSWVIAGIMQSITLDWRVRAICGVDTSNFTESPVPFETPCPLPQNPTVNNITGTSATVGWSAAPGYNTNVSDFVAGYRIAGSNGPWISLGHTSGFSLNISGLQPSTTYEWCVNQTCTYFNSDPVISTFTTLQASCGIPSSLQNNSISSTSASLTWAIVSGANAYELRYRTVGSNNWTTQSPINNNAYTIQNLQAGQNYEWQVAAICGSNNSQFSGSNNFSTLACMSSGNNAGEWIDYVRIGSINRSSGREMNGYSDTGLGTSLTIGSSYSFRFSADFSGGNKNELLAVFIDLNNNGTFDNNGEMIMGPVNITKSNNYNFTVNIPSTASPMNTKMRVIMMRNGSGNMSGCASGFYGETEDYNVSLINGGARLAASEPMIPIDDAIMAYPNPSNSEVNIKFGKDLEPTNYKLMNDYGRILKAGELQNNENLSIDLSQIPAGIYNLQIIDAKGKTSYKKLYRSE